MLEEYLISGPGQLFLSDFRSAELELCSLQGSRALSLSLSPPYGLTPCSSSRKVGADFTPSRRGSVFSVHLVGGGSFCPGAAHA